VPESLLEVGEARLEGDEGVAAEAREDVGDRAFLVVVGGRRPGRGRGREAEASGGEWSGGRGPASRRAEGEGADEAWRGGHVGLAGRRRAGVEKKQENKLSGTGRARGRCVAAARKWPGADQLARGGDDRARPGAQHEQLEASDAPLALGAQLCSTADGAGAATGRSSRRSEAADSDERARLDERTALALAPSGLFCLQAQHSAKMDSPMRRPSTSRDRDSFLEPDDDNKSEPAKRACVACRTVKVRPALILHREPS